MLVDGVVADLLHASDPSVLRKHTHHAAREACQVVILSSFYCSLVLIYFKLDWKGDMLRFDRLECARLVSPGRR